MNKFLPLCEPPLSLCSSPGQPFYWPPALRGPIAPGIREAAEYPRETSKSDRERGATLGTILGREGLLSVQKGASRVRNAESEGGGDARGPGQAGTAGGDGEQPRIPNLSRQRSAAREPAGGRGAERGAASPGFRQAALSGPREGRRHVCERGRGGERRGKRRAPPKIETAGGNGEKHKGSQRGAGARAPSVHAPESCGSGAGWGGTGSAGLETGHASIQEVTCEHGSWQRL